MDVKFRLVLGIELENYYCVYMFFDIAYLLPGKMHCLYDSIEIFYFHVLYTLPRKGSTHSWWGSYEARVSMWWVVEPHPSQSSGSLATNTPHRQSILAIILMSVSQQAV